MLLLTQGRIINKRGFKMSNDKWAAVAFIAMVIGIFLLTYLADGHF